MKVRCFNVPAACVLALVVVSTNARTGFADAAAPAATATTAKAPPDSATAPTSWSPVELVVYKSTRTLAVYRFGRFDKEYRMVLGLQPEGRKRHANDARTPEGLYHVVGVRPHPRWQYFLALDYPNAADRAAYDDAVKRGVIPDENGRPFAIGGDVGIHGTDREVEQDAGNDWTKGCIALRAADIARLAAIVTRGTPVWIVE